jgi:type 1 fimbria pilin
LGTIYLYLGAVTINITASACRLTTGTNTQVLMPTVNANVFNGIGSVSSASASFSVGLSCDAGVAVYATMTDASNPGNTGSTLSLSSN